jgi:protein O-GlcNAc transferase
MSGQHNRKQTRRQTRQRKSPTELVLQGNGLRRAGDCERAEKLYRRAINLDPRCADAWAELGCCLMEDDRNFPEAAACFRRVLDISPPAESALREGSQPTASVPALQLLEQILADRPNWTTGQLTLGCAYGRAREHDSARVHLASVLRLDPLLESPVECMFAAMHYRDQKWSEAIAAADRALARDPNNLVTHFIRSNSCSALSRMDQAMESNRRAVEISPSADYHSILLLRMNYLAQMTPEALYAEACRWNSLYAAPLAGRIRPHTNVPDPERRIKLGYVSPDLYNHAVMKFVPQVFEHHDPSRFEVFVYAVGSRSDYMTEDLRRSIENYLSIPLGGRELAERVRADGIDILVDLAGHSMGPSFLAFAEKPAPVQVSWIGILSTTGLSTMDYFLGDPHMPCPGTEHLFSETVYRLPVLCSYRPFATDLSVAASPCLDRGYITFGSFNGPRKITRDVVKLWSAILHLVPESRLLLKYHGLEKPALQDDLRRWFTEDGIPEQRLRFAGAVPPREYLAAYSDIDIALDPFPYNGGSTTLDTLWMGVPVVTLAGRMAVQRCGASLLTAAGLPDLVANTPEEYIKTALFLVQAVQSAPDLRRNVRQALQSSPLMDEVGLVRSVEDAYRDMWRAWCASQS